jgi:5-methylcytosine-specific restriction protein A
LASSIVHHWYGSRRWQDLRRDVIQAEPFCRLCLALGRRVLTAQVDHIRKHATDPALFWDRANLQGLCRPCHTQKTVRGE